MIIDAHHHLPRDESYPDRLEAECARLGIDRVCVFGSGRRGLGRGVSSNYDVIRAVEKKPGLLVGFAVFELGIDPPSRINEYVHLGFSGIKFINPLKNYDDKEYFPVYGMMESHRIPALFHLGIVSRTENDRYFDINNNRHRPIYLDTIARAFPGLRVIGAHLGNPWYEEATMSARWNPNLYFDLSGSTLKKKSSKFLGELLWWTPESRYRDPMGRHAWEKIVFGSDVGAGEIEDVLNDYRRVMRELNLPAGIQEKVLGGTMAGILGESRGDEEKNRAR